MLVDLLICFGGALIGWFGALLQSMEYGVQ